MAMGTSPPLATSTPINNSRPKHSSPSNFYYPPVPNLQHPPTAHVSHIKRLSEAQRTDPFRAQGSVSSGESGSSATSFLKQYQSSNSYVESPQATRHIVEGEPDRIRAQSVRIPHGSSGQVSLRQEMLESHSVVIGFLQGQQYIQHEEEQEDDHAIWILFWLSFPDVFYSLISCLYTIFIFLILVIVSPIRLLQKQACFGDRAIRLLAPIFRSHLQMIHAPSVEEAHTFDFSLAALIMVQLASPLLSFGVAIAAWVSAAFWGFAIIMGNPDGTEKRDDGRDAVLYVRDWWEKYLLKALRFKQRREWMV